MGLRHIRMFPSRTNRSNNCGICLCIIILGWFCADRLVASQSAPTREELLQTVKHIQSLADQTSQELAQEKEANQQAKAALMAANQAVTDAQNQFATYQKAAESEIAKGNAAITQLNSVVKKLHRAKWILCGLWICLCAFIALKIGGIPGLGTYGLLGIAGLAAGGCAAIWLWI